MGAVGRLGEGDFASLRGFGASPAKRPEAQAGQAVFAFAGYEEAGEEIHIFKHDGVAVGNEFGPVVAAGRGYWRGDEAEVAALRWCGCTRGRCDGRWSIPARLGAGLMRENSPSGWSAARNQHSLVMWLADSRTRYLPSRVRPAATLKRSSSS